MKIELYRGYLRPVFMRRDFLTRCGLPYDTVITPELIEEYHPCFVWSAIPVQSTARARKILLGEDTDEILRAIYYFADTDWYEPLDDYYIDSDEMLDLYTEWLEGQHYNKKYTREDLKNLLNGRKLKLIEENKRLKNENR